MRRLPGFYPNNTEEKVEWERLDPHHITPNARQLEVYHLKPNTSYQFRIWATNDVGAGPASVITARTVEPTQEKGLDKFLVLRTKLLMCLKLFRSNFANT